MDVGKGEAMKFSGKDIFTVESVTKQDKEVKSEVLDGLQAIVMIMETYGIDKVEI